MSEKVKVCIGGQFVVKFDGVVEMSRDLFNRLSSDLENDRDCICDDILLNVADALRNGYSDDFEVDTFELARNSHD